MLANFLDGPGLRLSVYFRLMTNVITNLAFLLGVGATTAWILFEKLIPSDIKQKPLFHNLITTIFAVAIIGVVATVMLIIERKHNQAYSTLLYAGVPRRAITNLQKPANKNINDALTRYIELNYIKRHYPDSGRSERFGESMNTILTTNKSIRTLTEQSGGRVEMVTTLYFMGAAQNDILTLDHVQLFEALRNGVVPDLVNEFVTNDIDPEIWGSFGGGVATLSSRLGTIGATA
jgi:hypothetical protein